MRLSMFLRPSTEYLGFKIFVIISVSLLGIQLFLVRHPSATNVSPTFTNTQFSHRIPGLLFHGDSQCLPEISQQSIDNSIAKHAVCRKHSPFATGRARIGLVTAHFGHQQSHYQKAFQTHLLHSLIYGTEMHVMCDPIVDDLWNKPAFLLNLLMHEMMQPEDRRLEWIMWVDRDTLILDQCRPISTFLPPEPSRYNGWWKRLDKPDRERVNTTHLLISKDLNGLNNGVFLLRVCSWAIELFTAILAFRHYNPGVELKFTEQSAMEIVINEGNFEDHVQIVPQHWFNGYSEGRPEQFKDRKDENGLSEEHVRRGDYLVHFAGNPNKEEAIDGWLDMLRELPDVWEHKNVQRDISIDVAEFWRRLGY